MTALGSLAPSLEFASSYALDINNRGQVVGLSDYPVSDGILWPRAFLWEKGRITDLGALPGRGLAGSWAYGINDRGQVVGYSMTASGMLHAFLWENGRMTSLTAQSGELYSVASDINNRGQMVGTLATKPLLILRCCNIVAR